MTRRQLTSRRELTAPLRVGPWWVGMLMILPLLPMMAVGLFVEAFDAFCKNARDQVADLRDAVAAIWADRKQPPPTYHSESEKPGWSGPGELIP